MAGLKVIVDSDCEDILSAAERSGFLPSKRTVPAEDQGGTHTAAIYEAAERYEAAEVLLLQPTSPFRSLSVYSQVDRMFDGFNSCVTVTRPISPGAFLDLDTPPVAYRIKTRLNATLGLWDGNMMLFNASMDIDQVGCLGVTNPYRYSFQVDYPGDIEEAEALLPSIPNRGLY